MESLISVRSLNISDELKNLLMENHIYTLEDFLQYSIGVFKESFHLTFDDWKSILDVFVSFQAINGIRDGVVEEAVKKVNKRKEAPCHALLINLFDEKYVVSTVKKGKWIHQDYLYKSVARGVVFLSREEAQKFAAMICENNDSKVIEREIQSAQKKIYVIHAYMKAKDKSILCIDDGFDKDKVLQACVSEKGYMTPQRAQKLAAIAVNRINKVYDYEIAELTTVACNEETLSVEEVSVLDAAVFATDDKLYVDARDYSRALDEFIDGDADSYLIWGRNAALNVCKARSFSAIQSTIPKYEQKFTECGEDAGITEEDVLYLKGYIDGLKLALEIQKQRMSKQFEIKVALIDCFGIISGMDVDPGWICSSIQEGNGTVRIDIFDNLEEAAGVATSYDVCYLLYHDRLAKEDKTSAVLFQSKFYERTKQALELIRFKNIKNALLQDLFLACKSEETEEEIEDD